MKKILKKSLPVSTLRSARKSAKTIPASQAHPSSQPRQKLTLQLTPDMPPSSLRIPPLLQPYIKGLPQGSLHLLTSVLGASANWLLIRYICGALGEIQPANSRRANDQDGTTTGLEGDDTAVVLVSFLRDWDFWKTEARRAAV